MLSSPCFSDNVSDAELSPGVTDAGLGALVEAGCGAKLTSLTLVGEWVHFVLAFSSFLVSPQPAIPHDHHGRIPQA